MTVRPAQETGGADEIEPILDPDLAIIDPHHHLWDRTPILPLIGTPAFGWQKVMFRTPRYLADEFRADLRGGHRVVATVHVEAASGYRTDGPEAWRPVGETEFVAAQAAQIEADLRGVVRPCAGIVGHVDLSLGDAVADVLEAHLAAGRGRFRGIRQSVTYDADPAVLGGLNAADPALYSSAAFRRGFARLAPLGLSFDTWLLEPQLGDLASLAQAFPDTTIVINHLGTPLGLGRYAGQRDARFPLWRESLRRLAELPNVTLKLGGLGMEFADLPSFFAVPAATSAQLAEQWRPHVETGIELFGVSRCMFESNYPAESGTADYRTIWNSFKRIVAGASIDEKMALFNTTAARVYRIDI